VKSAAFDYHRPSSADEAVQLLADLDGDAKVIAGGQSLVPMLALRLAYLDHLVDVGRIDELRGIERRNGSLWVGAATTQASVERNDELARSVPLLARVTPFIGHFQIRNRGTVGGSIAHADPAAEYPAVAVALDAEFDAVSTRGTRTIPASSFFGGMLTTALEPDELLAGIRFPVWTGRCGFAVQEFARRHGDFAIAGAVVGVELDDGGRVQRSAIGLIGLGSTPKRATTAEAELAGRQISDVQPDDIGAQAMAGLDDVPTDLHGSAAYRKRVGAAMVARAWADAVTEATGG